MVSTESSINLHVFHMHAELSMQVLKSNTQDNYLILKLFDNFLYLLLNCIELFSLQVKVNDKY